MSMRILIMGGGGMVGQKLARKLYTEGLERHSELDITLFDLGFPPSSDNKSTQVIGDLTSIEGLKDLTTKRFDIVYCLASIVSGEAEADFEKGWTTNMFSMWHFLEALRGEHDQSGGSYVPRVVFTSSIAVFGGPYPDVISDEFLTAPLSSYGAQKVICEQMVSDFSRKGFVDGVSIRLPTICVRPGKPNLAASSFFSGIIREPLNGQTAILPVSDTVRHWHASPRSAARFLTHCATLDLAKLGGRRALNMPGVSCTVAEQIEALRSIAGQSAVDLIKPQPDETIAQIVRGWPQNFAPERALSLGFEAEQNFEQIVQVYVEDELQPAS